MNALPQLYKVVNTAEFRQAQMRTVQVTGVSALLHISRAKVDYAPVIGQARLFLGPQIEGCPTTIAFNDKNAAFDFAGKRQGRVVYSLVGWGEAQPITQVLYVSNTMGGWAADLEKFWAAVRTFRPLDGFATRSAPAGSVAVWGVIALPELLTR